MYDTYLPYEFHLRLVATVADRYLHLLDDSKDYFPHLNRGRDLMVTLRDACLKAVWGHDLIEDARTNFNEVKANLGLEAANIVYAVTNEKGRDRDERANEAYYEGIRNTKGAAFVKLCDRIANVQYSKMTKSRMYDQYDKENSHFLKSIGFTGDQSFPYYEMVVELVNLFHHE
jgi:(p)ppGpp synthase/HD superfamily hydrolase